MKFLTHLQDLRLTLRPAVVLVYGWEDGKHACLNLTRGLTTFRIRSRVIYGRITFIKVSSSEVIFDTLGFQAAGFLTFYVEFKGSRLQMLCLRNFVFPAKNVTPYFY